MTRLLCVSWLSCLVLGACAAESPPPTTPPSKAEDPEPRSSEWIYATDSVPGGRKGECESVAARLSEEQTHCKGVLCAHGARLGKDWLGTCKSKTPDLVADVEQRTNALAEKAKSTPTPCEEEAERVLREGSCADKDCKGFIGTWGTRCTEASSPLVAKMLEVTIERHTGNKVRIDARSCQDLFAGFSGAISCDQQFKCQDAFPAIDAYRARCLTGGRLPTLAVAISEMSIRVGGVQTPEPIAVAAPSGDASLPNLLVPLEDASGSVLFVCGMRVGDLAAYLAARKGCEEDVVFARRFEENGALKLRLGRLAHPNDRVFLRRFPTFAVKGEPEARYDAALPAFNAALDQAARLGADSKQASDATRLLIEAIVANADAVRNSRVFEASLKQRDASLEPLFRAIGEAKKKILHADLEDRNFAPVMYRTDAFPLSDIAADGRSKIGASSAASAIELSDMLPRSMSAYRAALESRFKRLAKINLKEAVTLRLSGEADGSAARCAKAENGADAAEKTLIACGFGVERCEQARIDALAGELDRARKDAESHYASTALAIVSLGPQQRTGAWQAAKLAGCREPWW